MGAYSPAAPLDAYLEREIVETIVRPTVAGMRAEGRPFRGVLFVGLMIEASRPRVIEFNARFGDPETQALLFRLESDLVPLLVGAAEGRLPDESPPVRFGDPSVCVVLASEGYPRAYPTGREITGLEALAHLPGAKVFHSATRHVAGRWQTAGGRVLGVTARGELVAYPTETVYGLGAEAFSPAALARLVELKGREAERGLSVLVPDAAALARHAAPLPPAAALLAARFWPGPLTLVVPVADPRFAGVRTPLGVGFRCSSQPTACALARAAEQPVVSTSCNRSGAPPCTTAADVARAFGPTLAILGGEPASGLAPSTVVAVGCDGALTLLRGGSISFAELQRFPTA
jgi:tRNA threonylcarbamoyl adenosine modification protein (Sua5/YciO/YrdC/YwlC family)